jgi:hypothetical protein
MTLLSEIRPEAFTVGAQKKLTNGTTIAPLGYDGMPNCQFQLDKPLAVSFGPAAWGDSTRKTVSFALDPETYAALQQLEKQIATIGGLQNPHSALKRTDPYPPIFKVKVTDKTVVLDANGVPTAIEDWRDYHFKAIVSPRAIYQQRLMEGVTWELVGVMIFSATPTRQLTFV